ncbi:recombinase family protein [Flavobacteriaceae bacterium]|nr:recombinase family protein [Flavobacteriaceae bacterium]
MKVFYTRVSTQEQNDDRQKVNTKDFDYVLSDKISGVVDLWERPRGKQIKELIDEGKLKELHVHSIDRLGRNTLSVLSVWKELTDLGIRVVCRNPNIQNIDDNGKTDPFSQLLLELLSSMSSFEKSMIDMRRTEGIERTKILHPEKYSGRKIGSVVSTEKFLQLDKSQKIMKDLDNGYSVREIMEMRKCGSGLVSKVRKLRREVYETEQV